MAELARLQESRRAEMKAQDPGREPGPPIAEAMDRAMVDATQAASMAGEPINAEALTEGESRFLARLGPDQRSRLFAMDPGRRAEILSGFRRGFDAMKHRAACRILEPPPEPKVRYDASTPELIAMLAEGDPAAIPSAAEALCRDFGTEKDRQLWPAFRNLTEQVWRGEVPIEHVLDAHSQAMGPKAKNRGAVFTKAMKNHGWKP